MGQSAAQAAESLRAEGWAISAEALARLQEEQAAEEGSSQPAQPKELVLNTDLKKIGERALPSDLNSADSQVLKGPLILQVVAAEDVTNAPKGGGGGSKQRLLQLRLTDGKTTCRAIEFKPCPALDAKQLPPGTKVRLTGTVSVKLGIILLDAKSIQVLGGRVEALAEAWEFQQRYGTLDRGGDAQDPSAERPPPFHPYIPGRTRALPQHVLADIYQSTVADQAAAGQPGDQQPSSSGQEQDGADEHSRRTVPVDPSHQANAMQQAREAGQARQRLLAKLAEDESASGRGRGGRRGGGGRGGRRRRGRDDEEDDSSAMTLDEWEAKQKGQALQGGARQPPAHSDEDLARQLQYELDLEDGPIPPGLHFAQPTNQASRAHAQPHLAHQVSAAEELRKSLFSFDRGGEEEGPGGFGRVGRGPGGRRARGRRGRRGGR